jgi:hypothetical protein
MYRLTAGWFAGGQQQPGRYALADRATSDHSISVALIRIFERITRQLGYFESYL